MITYGKRIAKRATFDVGAKKSILGYIAATKRIPLGEAEVIYNGLIKEDNQKFALCLYLIDLKPKNPYAEILFDREKYSKLLQRINGKLDKIIQKQKTRSETKTEGNIFRELWGKNED